MDWKEALNALSAEDFPEAPKEEVPAEESVGNKIQKSPLTICTDRRQRKGKTATIIEGFECEDDLLKEIATKLKSTLGTGGSSRLGEILLQGDVKTKAAEYLKKEGYKVKIQ